MPLPAPSTAGEAAANFALGQLGTPYVWGGAAPGGFDCSGLVSWAYAQAGRGGLPHFTGALWNSGTHISSQSDLAPGDLVFFHGLGHVGMYIGGGNFVHAPHTGDVVKISNLGELQRLRRRCSHQRLSALGGARRAASSAARMPRRRRRARAAAASRCRRRSGCAAAARMPVGDGPAARIAPSSGTSGANSSAARLPSPAAAAS